MADHKSLPKLVTKNMEPPPLPSTPQRPRRPSAPLLSPTPSTPGRSAPPSTPPRSSSQSSPPTFSPQSTPGRTSRQLTPQMSPGSSFDLMKRDSIPSYRPKGSVSWVGRRSSVASSNSEENLKRWPSTSSLGSDSEVRASKRRRSSVTVLNMESPKTPTSKTISDENPASRSSERPNARLEPALEILSDATYAPRRAVLPIPKPDPALEILSQLVKLRNVAISLLDVYLSIVSLAHDLEAPGTTNWGEFQGCQRSQPIANMICGVYESIGTAQYSFSTSKNYDKISSIPSCDRLIASVDMVGDALRSVEADRPKKENAIGARRMRQVNEDLLPTVQSIAKLRDEYNTILLRRKGDVHGKVPSWADDLQDLTLKLSGSRPL